MRSSSPGGTIATSGRSMTTAPRSAWRGAASGRSMRSTAAWAVMSGINPQRGRIVFETALEILEKEKTILLGWPPLREDTKPYLGRSSGYPEGVRENGMYCHGVQWLVGAARILAEQAGARAGAEEARGTSRRPIGSGSRSRRSLTPAAGEIETYGGQPNKQAADMVTTFDPGRMIWNGYTGRGGLDVPAGPRGRAGTAPGRRPDGPPGRPRAGGRARACPRRPRSRRGARCRARRLASGRCRRS